MPAYETSATVEGEGQVHVVGVPFPPGTEVEVTIHPKRQPNPSLSPQAVDPVTQLCASLDKGRNSQPIGSLRREELYDRDNVH